MDHSTIQGTLLMPGEDGGTHFELNDSEYLNITLDSSVPIKVALESAPEMVTMNIESASGAASARITLSGFAPETTYHKYEDDYHNHTAFTADASGSYTYTQDLSARHFVFIQPRPSTKFINDNATGGDCTLIGIWNAATKTCTLNRDLTETIQIDSDGVTLDGNGYVITGSNTGSGVYLSGKKGVTIKNVNVRNFYYGIYLWYSSNNMLVGNTASNHNNGIYLWYSNNNTLSGNNANSNKGINNNGIGIVLDYSSNNTLSGNTASNNGYGIGLESSSNNTLSGNTANSNNGWGILLDYSSNNTLSGNTANSNTWDGIYLDHSSNNTIYHNNIINNTDQAKDNTGSNFWDSGYPSGGNYWSDYTGTDSNSDGIGDTPYPIPGGGSVDRYPLMAPYMPTPRTGCAIKLQKDGNEINEIDVGEFFNISVGGSTGAIKEVRFSSDESQNGIPEGEWTGWYSWTTSSGDWNAETKIKRWSFATDGVKEVWAEVKDDAGRTDSCSANINSKHWSFAIITDLHIGRGYPDYGGKGIGLEDGQVEGQEYYLTERLRNVVKWINDHKTENNIKFVAVLGDISDSGEHSELKKAKDILNDLNELTIPYIPIAGNHDIYPETEQDKRNLAIGDKQFEDVFSDQFEYLRTNFGEKNFIKQHHEAKPYYLQNYLLKYNGVNFIFLDFNYRWDITSYRSFGWIYPETVSWLEEFLNTRNKEEPIVIFSHEPMYHGGLPPYFERFLPGTFECPQVILGCSPDYQKLAELLRNSGTINFAGHVHGYYSPYEPWVPFKNPHFMDANHEYDRENSIGNINVITTEALMVGNNEIKPDGVKGIIRIVNVHGRNIEYVPETAEGDFPSINPYLYLLSKKVGIGINNEVRFKPKLRKMIGNN